MVDMVVIQSAVTGLKTAADIAVSISKLKSGAEINAKAIELQQVILSAQSNAFAAQSEQFSLVEKIRDLEKELASLKAWDTEKSRYKLLTLPGGGIAYALKKSMANSEPAHYICTSCYEIGRKSILNHRNDVRGWSQHACPVCKSEFPTGYRGSADAEYAPD